MPKKILFIASYPESLINFRLHLIKEFITRNYSVSIIAPHDKRVMDVLTSLGVKYRSIDLERNGSNPLKDLFLIRKLYSIIKNEKPDITFNYTIKPVIYGTLAAKFARVKNIYSMLTGTGYIFSKTTFKNYLIGLIAKQMFKFSLPLNKKLFFQNKDNLQTFLDEGLINSNQSVAIINGSGVDVNLFKPTVVPNELSFLMIARLLKDKGVYEYVEAAKILKKQFPRLIFKLVGWIDTNPNSISEGELAEWISEGNVQYLGKLSDVRDAIAQSAVYVLPSYGEGTPRTVLEAMAMARPIITTDVAGCRETVIEGKNGLLIQVQNVNALCQAMKFFVKFPNQIRLMGDESRKIAVNKYDVNKVNLSILHHMEIETLKSNTGMINENQIKFDKATTESAS